MANTTYTDVNMLVESVFYGLYTFSSLLIGLTGNSIVILATLRYTVLSLDSITMVFVRHLAVADIIYAVIRVFPAVTVHIGRRWVLGPAVCYISANFVTLPSLSSINFILAISIHRLLRCIFPLRFSVAVRRKATVLACLIWCYSSIGSIASVAMGVNQEFKPTTAVCDVQYTDVAIVATLGVVIQMLLPFFSIIFINIAMYIIARQRVKNVATAKGNWQAVITVAAVSGLFIVSWFPSILLYLMELGGVNRGTLVWLDKLQINFYIISVFGNPIIYSFVHRGFGRFARAKCNVVLRKCQHSVETKWNNSVGSSSNEKVQRRGSRKVSRDVVEDINIAERTEVVPAVSAEVRDTQLCSDSGICEITKESGITAVDT